MRLTLDLDKHTKNKVKAIAELLQKMFPESTVKYRTSCNGHGGHIVVYDSNLSHTDILYYRRFFGDDAKRIRKDTYRCKYNMPTQVLFGTKIKTNTYTVPNIKQAGQWITINTNK